MTEIIVAAPYCTPQRNAILTLLGSYGVTSAGSRCLLHLP